MAERCESIWVVVPAYNEAEIITEVIEPLTKCYPNAVVVDDCSKDDTGIKASNAGAVVLRHAVNLGQGAALQTGISYALLRGATHIVTFDADGQHQVDDITRLIATLRQKNVDVVTGSRFLGRAENLPTLRKLMLKAATIFMRWTTGLPLTDAHNGLRLFTRHAAQHIHISQNRMAHATEIIHQITQTGLTLAEAPVTIRYTDYSLRKGQTLGNSINIILDLLIERISR